MVHYHEAKVAPLIQKVPIDIYAIWFAQVLGYEGAYRRQVLGLEAVRVLDVLQLAGKTHAGWEEAAASKKNNQEQEGREPQVEAKRKNEHAAGLSRRGKKKRSSSMRGGGSGGGISKECHVSTARSQVLRTSTSIVRVGRGCRLSEATMTPLWARKNGVPSAGRTDGWVFICDDRPDDNERLLRREVVREVWLACWLRCPAWCLLSAV